MTAQRRYVLATDKDVEAGLIWSTGGVWSASSDFSNSLMTGPEADAFAARHPGAVVVDWPVYCEMAAVHRAAFVVALGGAKRSTTELRAKAREAGRLALAQAGYTRAAAKRNPLNPCEA